MTDPQATLLGMAIASVAILISWWFDRERRARETAQRMAECHATDEFIRAEYRPGFARRVLRHMPAARARRRRVRIQAQLDLERNFDGVMSLVRATPPAGDPWPPDGPAITPELMEGLLANVPESEFGLCAQCRDGLDEMRTRATAHGAHHPGAEAANLRRVVRHCSQGQHLPGAIR